MRPVCCDFCGSMETKPLYSLRNWLEKDSGVYPLVQCQNCGLLYLNPQPEWQDLAAFYAIDYHPYQANTSTGIKNFIKNAGWSRRSKAVQKRQKSGRLLDVGCATGEFLMEIERGGGWECFGVEPVEHPAKLAASRTRAKIFEGTLLQAQYPDHFFDVVTLWDVLEHTNNPSNVLTEVFRILRPGGMVVIRVPDPRSLTARIFGEHWIGYDAPRHLFSFPRPVLIRKLSDIGFNQFEVAYLSNEIFTVFTSIGAVLTDRDWKRPGNAAKALANSAFFRVLMAPIFTPMRWINVGSSPVYFARKA